MKNAAQYQRAVFALCADPARKQFYQCLAATSLRAPTAMSRSQTALFAGRPSKVDTVPFSEVLYLCVQQYSRRDKRIRGAALLEAPDVRGPLYEALAAIFSLYRARVRCCMC